VVSCVDGEDRTAGGAQQLRVLGVVGHDVNEGVAVAAFDGQRLQVVGVHREWALEGGLPQLDGIRLTVGGGDVERRLEGREFAGAADGELGGYRRQGGEAQRGQRQ
jgi:hypothetical protein